MSKNQPGTFADLYDVEQRIKPSRLGRPRRAQSRKQVTLYLTSEQDNILSDLQHSWSKQFKIDRSDIAGLAIQLLEHLVENKNEILDFTTFESLKVYILEQLTK